MEFDDAIAKLDSKGFVIGEKNEITDDEIEEGKVIKTEPEVEELLKKIRKLIFI